MTNDATPLIVDCLLGAKKLPIGVLPARTQIDSGTGCGGKVWGMGATDQARADDAWDNYPVTEIVDAREDKSTPLFKIRRSKLHVVDVGFKGQPQDNNTFEISDSTLIEVTQQGASWPVGQITFERVTLTCAKRGWYFAPGSHADHITQIDCGTHMVKRPYTVEENQSVDHRLDMLCRGGGEVLVDLIEGGRMTGHVWLNGKWQRLLMLGKDNTNVGTKNNGVIDLRVTIDADDSIEHILEERDAYTWGAYDITIIGQTAHDALIGWPLLKNKSRVRINIRNPFKPFVWEAN